jgi:hypothetical protein
MAGQTLSGDRGAALRSFGQHRGKLNTGPGWQPVFRFLVAHAEGSIIK